MNLKRMVKDAVNILYHIVTSSIICWWSCIIWLGLTDYEDDEHDIGVTIAILMIFIGLIVTIGCEYCILKKVKKKKRYVLETIITFLITAMVYYKLFF